MGSPYREQEMSDTFEPSGFRWPSIPWYVPVLLGVIGIGAAIDYIHTPGLRGRHCRGVRALQCDSLYQEARHREGARMKSFSFEEFKALAERSDIDVEEAWRQIVSVVNADRLDSIKATERAFSDCASLLALRTNELHEAMRQNAELWDEVTSTGSRLRETEDHLRLVEKRHKEQYARASRLQNECSLLRDALMSNDPGIRTSLALSRLENAQLLKENARMADRIGRLRRELAKATETPCCETSEECAEKFEAATSGSLSADECAELSAAFGAIARKLREAGR